MTTQQSDALAHIADEDDSAFVAATMTGMQHTKLQKLPDLNMLDLSFMHCRVINGRVGLQRTSMS